MIYINVNRRNESNTSVLQLVYGKVVAVDLFRVPAQTGQIIFALFQAPQLCDREQVRAWGLRCHELLQRRDANPSHRRRRCWKYRHRQKPGWNSSWWGSYGLFKKIMALKIFCQLCHFVMDSAILRVFSPKMSNAFGVNEVLCFSSVLCTLTS